MKHLQYLVVLCLLTHPLVAQQPSIGLSGYVIDDQSRPIPNATVRIQGTDRGTITNEQGRFTLNPTSRKEGSIKLSASHINYYPNTIEVTAAFTDTSQVIILERVNHELKNVEVQAEKPTLNKQKVEVLKGISSKLEETPYSVQVLNAAFIERTAKRTLVEVLQHTNGITYNASTYNNLFARGFPLSPSNYLLDGQQGGTSGIAAAPQVLYNVEAIQVLKGPTGAINGNAEPGALINIITKKPQFESRSNLTFQAGSFNFYEGVADLNLSLVENKLATRWIAAYQNTGSFKTFNTNENIFLAPSLSWQLDKQSSLLFSGTYLKRKGLGGGWHHRGILAIDNDLSRLPVTWTPHEQSDHTENTAWLSLLQYDRTFKNGYEVTAQIRYQQDDFQRSTHSAIAGTYDPVTAEVTREYQITTHLTNNVYVNTYLHKAYDISGIELHTSLGVDYVARRDNRTAQFFRGNVSSLNIDQPEYSSTNTDEYLLDRLNAHSEEPIYSTGIYFQSNQRWSPKLMTMFSFRWNHVAQSSNTTYLIQERTSTFDQTLTAFNPTLGLTYKLLPKTNLYANYSTGFQPQFAYRALVNFNNVAINPDPEHTYQFEAGFKQQLFKDRLLLTTAYYYLEKSNILGVDPNNIDVRIPINGAISQGIELSLLGQLGNFQLIASYAYNNLQLDQPDIAANFHSSINNPRHNLNFWATQAWQINAVEMSAGVGATHWSNREVNSGELILPAFATFSAMVSASYQEIEIRSNIENLLNETYFTGGSSQYVIFPGPPFNANVSLTYTF
ncbi:MAG: TonB-dependent receptor domain-containing protein [Thermonemataceae bacterium]